MRSPVPVGSAARFDWKAQLEQLAVFDHYRFIAPDAAVHFIHARGRGPHPVPLILTHGWPGSFLEMVKIIPLPTEASFDVGGSISARVRLFRSSVAPRHEPVPHRQSLGPPWEEPSLLAQDIAEFFHG